MQGRIWHCKARHIQAGRVCRLGGAGAHRRDLREVLRALWLGHAVEDTGVGLEDAVAQQRVVLVRVLVARLLLRHRQRLRAAGNPCSP